MAALPTTAPSFGGDQDAQNEYLAALERVQQSFENRNKTNWFSIAGALLNPGRTGSFGEALGRVGDVLGAQQAQQEQQEPQIAMMRAQLAAQKYEVANQGKAMNMLGGVFGMDPAKVAEGLQNGTINANDPSFASKLTPQLYTQISLLYPKLGETLKGAFGMDIEKGKLKSQNDTNQIAAIEKLAKNPELLPVFKQMGVVPADATLDAIINGTAPVNGSVLNDAITPQDKKPPAQGQEVGGGSGNTQPPAANQNQRAGQQSFSMPVDVASSRLTSPFGPRTNPVTQQQENHPGWDMAAPKGTPVASIGNGTVLHVGADSGTKTDYGNNVIVDYGNGITVRYGHLDKIDPNLKEGAPIGAGVPIGGVGSTGLSTGNHLDMSVFKDGKPVDPATIFGNPWSKPGSPMASVEPVQTNKGIQVTTPIPPREPGEPLDAYRERVKSVTQANIEISREAAKVPIAIQQRQKESDIAVGQKQKESDIAVEQKGKESNIDVGQKDREARQAPYIEKHNQIASYDYNTVQQNNTKLAELMALVKAHPAAVGQLTHQGPMFALAQLAESGVSTPIGSLSVPVTDALNKLNLPDKEQEAARNIAQLISDLNQSVMKTGKSIYGPQISTFDAQQMAKPGFKDTDPASFITYLGAKQRVVNTYMGKMAEAQADYFDAHPTASTASFQRSKVYKDIVDEFNVTYRDLTSKSPYR